MRCTYHAHVDASTECSLCKMPLCEECGMPGSDGTTICGACVAVQAAQDFGLEAQQREEEKEHKILQREADKKKRQLKIRLAFVSLALAVVIVNLIAYFGSSISVVEPFIPSEDPVATAMIIDEAIRDYSKDHESAFPHRLNELLGKYISAEGITSSDLQDFHYVRTASDSYKLWPKKPYSGLTPDLVFTEGGSNS